MIIVIKKPSKEKTLYYRMEENHDENKQKCSKCKQYRDLDWFKPERKQCNQCLETKKRYREKHKEQISNYSKTYYNQRKGRSGETQRRKEHKEQKLNEFIEKLREQTKQLIEENREFNAQIKKREEHRKFVEDVFNMIRVDMQNFKTKPRNKAS